MAHERSRGNEGGRDHGRRGSDCDSKFKTAPAIPPRAVQGCLSRFLAPQPSLITTKTEWYLTILRRLAVAMCRWVIISKTMLKKLSQMPAQTPSLRYRSRTRTPHLTPPVRTPEFLLATLAWLARLTGALSAFLRVGTTQEGALRLVNGQQPERTFGAPGSLVAKFSKWFPNLGKLTEPRRVAFPSFKYDTKDSLLVHGGPLGSVTYLACEPSGT